MSRYYLFDVPKERLIGAAQDLGEAKRAAIHHQKSDFDSSYPAIVVISGGEISLIDPACCKGVKNEAL